MKNFARITLINEEEERIELVEITEDLAYRDRIINELATMALEGCPMLNVPEKDRHKPFISMPHIFEHSEYDDINDVIDVKTEEFEKLMEPIILNHFNITLKENQWVFFMESYQIPKEDLEQGIVMDYTIEICDNNF
jgi:hypothetical protein